MRQLATLLAVVVALVATGRQSQAAFFTTEASFLAALNLGFYTNTFDGPINNSNSGSPVGQNFSGPSPVNTFSYTAVAGGGSGVFVAGSGGLTGSQFLKTTVQGNALTFTFTSNNVTAFGGYFFLSSFNVDGGNTFNPAPVTLTIDGVAQTIPGATRTGVDDTVFLGFTSASLIGNFTLGTPTGGLFNSVDNLTVGIAAPTGAGNAVPLPPTAVLAGFAGLFGLIGVVRRRA